MGDVGTLETGFQSRLSIMLTRRCNLRCRHCCVEALPASARGGDLQEHDLRAWLEQIGPTHKVTYLSLTGGEPFLAPALLRVAVGLAAEQGLALGVVTNGFWAASPAAAQRQLEPFLPWAQALTLSLSVDRFHQEHVPLERIRYAIAAARAVGIQRIKIKLGYLGGSADQHTEWLLQALGEPVGSLLVECRPIHRTGRAARQVASEEFVGTPDERLVSLMEIPCAVADFPLITPEGKVYACCGAALLLKHPTPLLLGDLRDETLGEILERSEANAILHFIRLYGPGQLFARMGRQVTLQEADATNLCSLCLKFFASPRLVADLEQRLQEPAWQQMVHEIAVRRLLYRNEAAMLAGRPHTRA